MIEIKTGGSVYYVAANSFESPDVAPATLPVALGYYLRSSNSRGSFCRSIPSVNSKVYNLDDSQFSFPPYVLVKWRSFTVMGAMVRWKIDKLRLFSQP